MIAEYGHGDPLTRFWCQPGPDRAVDCWTWGLPA